MTAEAAKVRLFAALEVPHDVRAALHGWALPLERDEPALRVLAPESLHVTLLFLGWQPAEEIDDIAAAMLGVARPLPEVGVTQAAWLPPRRPGVLVVDLSAEPAVFELQAELVLALEGRHEPENRPYRPHVTVARVRRGHRIASREVPPPPPLRFVPAAVALYRSHLGRAGAVYEVVARG